MDSHPIAYSLLDSDLKELLHTITSFHKMGLKVTPMVNPIEIFIREFSDIFRCLIGIKNKLLPMYAPGNVIKSD